jgi:hypothetical protein
LTKEGLRERRELRELRELRGLRERRELGELRYGYLTQQSLYGLAAWEG